MSQEDMFTESISYGSLGIIAMESCKGLGNKEWNESAPHGSGRIASRDNVRHSHTVSEFKSEMKGVYTTCISADTLDEAPFAYRRTDYIREVIKDTVIIDKLLKPLYNYKGGNK